MPSILEKKVCITLVFFEWCYDLWKSELNIILEIKKFNKFFPKSLEFCIEIKNFYKRMWCVWKLWLYEKFWGKGFI
jgi:hypothetical protein